MRVEVEVRQRSVRGAADIWPAASDPSGWPTMPGAALVYRVLETDSTGHLRYAIVGGLPVRDHEGWVHLVPTDGGTEIVVRESFRARIWGTAGFLRGRRERALVDVARVLAHS